MLKSKCNWKYIDTSTTTGINELEGISPIMKKLLLQRGITTMEQADKFLSPRLEDLHNPNLLQSMEKAVDRVHQAIQDDEKF